MLTESQAKSVFKDTMEKIFPGIKIKAWTKYHEYYLFRVEYPSEEEKDFDPFFSVDSTGKIREFAILTDGDISELSKLTWNDV